MSHRSYENAKSFLLFGFVLCVCTRVFFQRSISSSFLLDLFQCASSSATFVTSYSTLPDYSNSKNERKQKRKEKKEKTFSARQTICSVFIYFAIYFAHEVFVFFFRFFLVRCVLCDNLFHGTYSR